MVIVCVDNTPIMLQSLKEDADRAYPNANVQAFLTAEPALAYAQKFGCDVLLCEINPPRLEVIISILALLLTLPTYVLLSFFLGV